MQRDEKGRFATGNKGGGRPKGVRNRDTEDLRRFLEDTLNDNREQIIKDLKKLDPKDRLQIIEKLLSYVLPRLQAIDQKVDFTQLSDEQIDLFIEKLKEESPLKSGDLKFQK